MEQAPGEEKGGYVPMIVNETPKFDLEAYIANYVGRSKFRRLFLIALCSPHLRTEALRAAVTEAAAGKDVRHYREVMQLLNHAGLEVGGLDSAWAEKQEKLNKAETNRLEHELKGYKNNLIKESIRMGNEDLGNHYYSIGDLSNALKAYGRMREYCTTPAHIASSAFRIIQVAIEQANWMAVSSQVHKIRNLQMKAEETARSQPKTLAAMGLQHMCSGEYREAANSFLATDPSLGDGYREVLSSNDVAVYGGLCALASMDRKELQTKVLENASFRNFLELEPHIRRAVSYYCSSKYSQCLAVLDSYRADYLLDIYLQPHLSQIYRRIRTKSIVQFFAPFSHVTLDAMAQTFGPTERSSHPASTAAVNVTVATSSPLASTTATNTRDQQLIDDELVQLIDTGVLHAQIDLEHRILIAKEADLRAELHAEAHAAVSNFLRESHLRILRMNAIQAGLEVKPAAKPKQSQ